VIKDFAGAARKAKLEQALQERKHAKRWMNELIAQNKTTGVNTKLQDASIIEQSLSWLLVNNSDYALETTRQAHSLNRATDW